jgi:hypothetical protein
MTRPPRDLGLGAPLAKTDGWWIPWIGRLTLYSFTIWSLAFSGSVLTSFLWLVPGIRQRPGFVTLHAMLVGGAFLAGAVLFVALFLLHRFLVPDPGITHRRLDQARVHVGLTAYNDEEAIGQAVRDFKSAPQIHRVVVVDNDSRDATVRVAQEAGADLVVVETARGYGACCQRALAEAAVGADVVVLCEGDVTFRAADVKKFLAYLENCEMVLGSRSTQELRDPGTQMDWLINPANQIVAKLIQIRFWGVRLTDVGCTYRAIREDSYRRLAHHLTVRGNHFSPHMFIEALKLRMRVIEIPVAFRIRVGESKGVGANKLEAARTALRMLGLLYRA